MYTVVILCDNYRLPLTVATPPRVWDGQPSGRSSYDVLALEKSQADNSCQIRKGPTVSFSDVADRVVHYAA